MLKDITIGQYYSTESVVHRLDPRAKLLLTIAYIVLLFCIKSTYAYIVPILIVLLVYVLAKIPFRMLIKSMKPIIPILIFTSIVNMFFVSGQILVQIAFLNITAEGLLLAATMSIRIICLIAGASLLTYTTTPITLTDGIEVLLSPLKRFRFPAHELAMMMTIALRFIPTLIEETDKIMNAQKARGASMDTGNLMQRAKALIPILIPLFVSAFRRAEELALAMECRCYRGGEGRTRMQKLQFAFRDLGAALFMIVCFAIVITINILG